MTTVFIWNDNMIRHRFDKRAAHGKSVVGHACLNIDDTWTQPFTEHDGLNDEIDECYELQQTEQPPDPRLDNEVFLALTLAEMGEMEREYFQDLNRWLAVQQEARGRLNNLFTDNRDSYVSWWPAQEGRSHRDDGTEKYRRGEGHRNIWIDLLEEGYAPDHIIRIPNNPKSVTRMKTKWLKEKAKNDGNSSYSLYNKNCSRMAARILHAGFKGRYKHGYGVKRGLVSIWSPVEVKRMALNIKGARTMLWDDFVEEIWQTVPELNSFRQKASLKAFTKRASNRGSSGADSRFKFSRGGSRLISSMDKNTMAFLTPPLTVENANWLKSHIYGFETALLSEPEIAVEDSEDDSSEEI